MNKRVFNLSLLMLLSASSNVFGMGEGKNAYILVDQPVQEITEKLNQATVELLADCASGTAQTSLNSAVDALSRVDDSKLTELSEAVKYGFARSYNVLTGLLPSRESKIIKSVLNSRTNLKTIIEDFARNNPKTAGAIAATGAGLCAYGAYKYTKGAGAKLQKETRTIGGGAAAEARFTAIDPNLKAQIDAEIIERGGVDELVGTGLETRTLLMQYSEGYNSNLEAVKYLVEEKKADVNLKDTYQSDWSGPRNALTYASSHGSADIVEYFASLPKKIDTTEARKYAQLGFQLDQMNEANYDRIIAALDLIDKK
jgi:hypothetical protein